MRTACVSACGLEPAGFTGAGSKADGGAEGQSSGAGSRHGRMAAMPTCSRRSGGAAELRSASASVPSLTHQKRSTVVPRVLDHADPSARPRRPECTTMPKVERLTAGEIKPVSEVAT